jgi:hypothetical protein
MRVEDTLLRDGLVGLGLVGFERTVMVGMFREKKGYVVKVVLVVFGKVEEELLCLEGLLAVMVVCAGEIFAFWVVPGFVCRGVSLFFVVGVVVALHGVVDCCACW